MQEFREIQRPTRLPSRSRDVEKPVHLPSGRTYFRDRRNLTSFLNGSRSTREGMQETSLPSGTRKMAQPAHLPSSSRSNNFGRALMGQMN